MSNSYVVKELEGATNVWVVLHNGTVIWYGKSLIQAQEVARKEALKRAA